MIFYSVVGFLTSRLFQQYWWCYHPSFDVSPRSFYFFNIFSLISLHKLQIEEERKKTKKKKILEAHQSFDNDTTCIIGKISTREIQQHQRSSQMVDGEGHMSYPKMSGFTCLWATHVAYSGVHEILVLLDLSYWDLSSTDGVIIEALMWLQDPFFLSLSSFLINFLITSWFICDSLSILSF